MLDKHATQKHAMVKQRLAERPRQHLHHTMTQSSVVQPFGPVVRIAQRTGAEAGHVPRGVRTGADLIWCAAVNGSILDRMKSSSTRSSYSGQQAELRPESKLILKRHTSRRSPNPTLVEVAALIRQCPVSCSRLGT